MMKKGHIVEQTTNDLLISGLTQYIGHKEIYGFDGWKDIAEKVLKLIKEGKLDFDSPFDSIIFGRIVLSVFRQAFIYAIPDEAERQPYKLWWERYEGFYAASNVYEYRRDAKGVLTRKDYKSSDVGYQEKYAQRVKVDNLEENALENWSAD